jgi:hypothetical protein
MLQADGSLVDLQLLDVDQQQQAVKDLLQRQLIQAAANEQHAAPGSDWFSRAAGMSANYVLTTGSHESNPLHMMALLTLLLRCHLRVQVPTRQMGAPSMANNNTAADTTPGSKRPRVMPQYVFISPPASSAVAAAAAVQADDGGAAAAAVQPVCREHNMLGASWCNTYAKKPTIA